MFTQLRKRGFALAMALMAVFCLGFVAPALAEGEEEAATYLPNEARLTKVIIAPENADASNDEFVFQFEGKGEVRDGNASNGENADKLYSADGIEQDNRTIVKGDEIPQIPDVTIKGRVVTSDNSLHTDKTFQTVNSMTLAEILKDVTFPHAGVYTYRVSEKSAPSQNADGSIINSSKAAYILRVRVINDTSSQEAIENKKTVVKDLTVEKVLNDEGKANDVDKTDPTYPRATDTGLITNIDENTVPTEGELAGTDVRGRDVYGFTFANEYMKGGTFTVKKLVKGDFADKTKKFHIVVELTDEIATTPLAQGCVATYVVTGGDDVTTSNTVTGGGHTTLNGVYGIDQSSQSMVPFDPITGTATIVADLSEGGSITVTGVFGPYVESYVGANGRDKRSTVSTAGPSADTEFKVTETEPGSYVPSGYVNPSEEDIDPRTDGFVAPAGWTYEGGTEGEKLEIEGAVSKDGNIIYVVNTLDDSHASPTGIFINNLPYILMVGIPVAVFATMFVLKRRASAEA